MATFRCQRCQQDCCQCSGCQPMTASDGTIGCGRCIPGYQNQLNAINQQQTEKLLQSLQQNTTYGKLQAAHQGHR